MGILDEAIREHLELKRQSGADDSELKQLEDQAFGQAERPGEPAGEETAPDSAAEAPTEFMLQPDLGEGDERRHEPAELPPSARRETADIQEPPEPAKKAEEDAPDEPAAEKGDEPVEEDAGEPVAEEQSAAEHEAIPAPPVGSHTTEERHAIADQPTEMFDVEEEFTSTEAPAPPDEDLVAEELTEARLGPADPTTSPIPEPPDDEEDDDFFDEKRLSEELDQALEAPIEPEPISEEHEVIAEKTDEHEETSRVEKKRDRDEDVLEETPDFLEEAPEDDQLWFEQKPPKDFDFDD